ncbi:MAG: hypothetical protein R2854_24125 [Caldilineaceae bacterium]
MSVIGCGGDTKARAEALLRKALTLGLALERSRDHQPALLLVPVHARLLSSWARRQDRRRVARPCICAASLAETYLTERNLRLPTTNGLRCGRRISAVTLALIGGREEKIGKLN